MGFEYHLRGMTRRYPIKDDGKHKGPIGTKGSHTLGTHK